MACKFVTGSGDDAHVQWNSTVIPAAAKAWFRFYAYFTANPGETTSLCTVLDTSQNKICTVSLNTSGKFLLQYGASRTVIFTAVTSIPLNQWFRVEGFSVASATAGQVAIQTYVAEMDAVYPTETYTAGNLNTGSGTPDYYSFGTFYDAVGTGPYWLASLAVSTAGPIGPVIPEQPATGYAWFGAYPGAGNADPGSYETNVAGRQLGCWYRYYAINSSDNVPTSDDVTQADAGRLLIMSLATSYNTVPPGPRYSLRRDRTAWPCPALPARGAERPVVPVTGRLPVVRHPGCRAHRRLSRHDPYTGLSGNSFTGCKTTAGSGTLATGNKAATQWSWAATANEDKLISEWVTGVPAALSALTTT